ncbi:MAG: hypothetical protein ABJE95_20865 [Byssovorax sp.]
MTKPAGDPLNSPAPTPRPRTPALIRGGAVAAAITLGLAGCGGGDAVPPQVVPPQAPPPDLTATPPQVVPPQMPPPPQVAPPPPNQPNSKTPQSSPPNQR